MFYILMFPVLDVIIQGTPYGCFRVRKGCL